MTGYIHPGYAASFAEFGTPRFLPLSGGWVLERSIPQTPYRDAMGCYPLFACKNWPSIQVDLDELEGDLVSIALVADPFGDHNPILLRECFPDLVVPFKEHLVTNLSSSPDTFVDAGHRRKAQKALGRLNVELCKDASLFADDWIRLYANLVRRHDIRGLTAFSANSLKAQLAVPGMHMFGAADGEEIVGMTLWYATGEVAYYHLGAYSDKGYDLKASFALFWQVIDYFSSHGLHWLNLGAGAGLSGNRIEDGLSRFKRGWATDSRTAYFCGRVLDRRRYAEIINLNRERSSDYFPAYRKGEFG